MYIKLDKQYEVKCTLGTIRDIERSFEKSFFEIVNDLTKMKTVDQIKLIYIGVRRANNDIDEEEFIKKCEEHLGIGDLMELLEKYFFSMQYPGLSTEEVQQKIEKKLAQNQMIDKNRNLIGKQ